LTTPLSMLRQLSRQIVGFPLELPRQRAWLDLRRSFPEALQLPGPAQRHRHSGRQLPGARDSAAASLAISPLLLPPPRAPPPSDLSQSPPGNLRAEVALRPPPKRPRPHTPTIPPPPPAGADGGEEQEILWRVRYLPSLDWSIIQYVGRPLRYQAQPPRVWKTTFIPNCVLVAFPFCPFGEEFHSPFPSENGKHASSGVQ
jgi:hypothetical protein